MDAAAERAARDLAASVNSSRASGLAVNCGRKLKATGALLGKRGTSLNVQRALRDVTAAAANLQAISERMGTLSSKLPFQQS